MYQVVENEEKTWNLFPSYYHCTYFDPSTALFQKAVCPFFSPPVLLSADNFSSALQVLSSKEEGDEGELFDKFFIAFIVDPSREP